MAEPRGNDNPSGLPLLPPERRRPPATMTPSPAERLANVRRYRVRPDRDLSLAFLSDQFRQQIRKPYRQLGGVAEVWQQLVPADLAAHTRLDSLSRGTLTVAVDSSARLYALDSMLRQGLETRLVTACRGTSVRRIRLRQENLA